jgi:hypothetical protein
VRRFLRVRVQISVRADSGYRVADRAVEQSQLARRKAKSSHRPLSRTVSVQLGRRGIVLGRFDQATVDDVVGAGDVGGAF